VDTPTPNQGSYYLPATETTWTTDGEGVQFAMLNTKIPPIDFWAASTGYGFGVKIRPANPNGFLYAVTTGGTSGGAAPTWGTTVGGSTTDNTVTWRNLGPDPAAVSGAVTLDFGSGGNTLTYWLSGNITSYTAVNPIRDQQVWLHFIQGTTGYTIAGPSANIKFAGGNVPAAAPAAGKRLIYSFWSDGTNLHEMSRSVAVG
jgi:hypothetical protein